MTHIPLALINSFLDPSAAASVEHFAGVTPGVGGATIADFDYDLQKRLLKYVFEQNTPRGSGAARANKYATLVLGALDFLATPDPVPVGRIIDGLFDHANIPLQHVVVTDGEVDTVAEALIIAQMDAAFAFMIEHRDYFFGRSDVLGGTGQRGRTLHEFDQFLLSRSSERRVQRTLRNAKKSYESVLIYESINFRFHGNPTAEARTFYLALREFSERANLYNTLFMAAMANATCAALSPITPVPPVISQTQYQLRSDADRLLNDTRQQQHTTTRRELDAAREELRQLNLTPHPNPLRFEPARARYEAARQAYVNASAELGVAPDLRHEIVERLQNRADVEDGGN